MGRQWYRPGSQQSKGMKKNQEGHNQPHVAVTKSQLERPLIFPATILKMPAWEKLISISSADTFYRYFMVKQGDDKWSKLN